MGTNTLARLPPPSKTQWKGRQFVLFSWALLKLFTFDVWVEKRQESTLTRGCVGDSVHLQDEVVLEENVADDGEQVDQDESQYGGQHNGAPVARHALDHVQQRLLSVHKVE